VHHCNAKKCNLVVQPYDLVDPVRGRARSHRQGATISAVYKACASGRARERSKTASMSGPKLAPSRLFSSRLWCWATPSRTSARRCAAAMRQTAPPVPRVPSDPVGR